MDNFKLRPSLHSHAKKLNLPTGSLVDGNDQVSHATLKTQDAFVSQIFMREMMSENHNRRAVVLLGPDYDQALEAVTNGRHDHVVLLFTPDARNTLRFTSFEDSIGLQKHLSEFMMDSKYITNKSYTISDFDSYCKGISSGSINHNCIFSLVASKNAHISSGLGCVSKLLHYLFLHNCSNGEMVIPILLRQLPVPEELPSLRLSRSYSIFSAKKYFVPDPIGETIHVPELGYAISISSIDSNKVHFRPYDSDNERHVEYVYQEDLDGWIEATRRFYPFSTGSGDACLVTEELTACGVMVCYRSTLKYSLKDIIETPFDRKRLITLVVPHSGVGTFGYVTIPSALLEDISSLFATHITFGNGGMSPTDFSRLLNDKTQFDTIAAIMKARSFVIANTGSTKTQGWSILDVWTAGCSWAYATSNIAAGLSGNGDWSRTLTANFETVFGDLGSQMRSSYVTAQRVVDMCPFGYERKINIHNDRVTKMLLTPSDGCLRSWFSRNYDLTLDLFEMIEDIKMADEDHFVECLREAGHAVIRYTSSEYWFKVFNASIPGAARTFVIKYPAHYHIMHYAGITTDAYPEKKSSQAEAATLIAKLSTAEPVLQTGVYFGPDTVGVTSKRVMQKGAYKNGVFISSLLKNAAEIGISEIVYAGCASQGVQHTVQELYETQNAPIIAFIDPATTPTEENIVASAKRRGYSVNIYADNKAYTDDLVKPASLTVMRFPPLPFHADFTPTVSTAVRGYNVDNIRADCARRMLSFREDTILSHVGAFVETLMFDSLVTSTAPIPTGIDYGPSYFNDKISVYSYTLRYSAGFLTYYANVDSSIAYSRAVDRYNHACATYRVAVTAIQPRRPGERIDDMYHRIGRQIHTASEVGPSELRISTTFRFRVLYSDACTVNDDVIDFDFANEFTYSFFKYRTRIGKKRYLALPPGYRLFYKPSACTTEFTIGNIPLGLIPELDLLDVALDGYRHDVNGQGDLKRIVLDSVRLSKHAENSAIQRRSTSRNLCALRTLAAVLGGHMGRHITSTFCEPTTQKFEPYIKTFLGVESDLERHFHLTDDTYKPDPGVVFLKYYDSPYAMLKTRRPKDDVEAKYLESIGVSTYRVSITRDPISTLLERRAVLVFDGAAGCGKTTICAAVGRSVFYVAPTGPVADDGKGKFYYAGTFDLALSELICLTGTNRASRFKYVFLDEFQFMGPRIFIFAQLCVDHGLKLILGGELCQQPWMNTETNEYAKDIGALHSIAKFQTLPRHVSHTSFRFNAEAARILSLVVGHEITGLGDAKLEMVFGSDLNNVLLKISREMNDGTIRPGTKFVVLNTETKEFVNSFLPVQPDDVMTATVATGLNFTGDSSCIFIGHTRGVAPFSTPIGGKLVNTAVYVALSRGNVLAYVPEGFIGLTSTTYQGARAEPLHYQCPGAVKDVVFNFGSPITGLVKPFSVDPQYIELIPRPYIATDDPATFLGDVVAGRHKNIKRHVNIVTKNNPGINLREMINSSKDFRVDATARQLIKALSSDMDEETRNLQQIKYGDTDLGKLVNKRPKVISPEDTITYNRSANLTTVVLNVRNTTEGQIDADRKVGKFGRFTADLYNNNIMHSTTLVGPGPTMVNAAHTGEKVVSAVKDISTGQFHERHAELANLLVAGHYDSVPIIRGYCLHGQVTDLLSKFKSCSSSVRSDGNVLFGEEKDMDVKTLARHAYAAHFHFGGPTQTLASSLARYGPQSFDKRVAGMGPHGPAYSNAVITKIDSALQVILRKCNVSRIKTFEFDMLVEMHKLAYLTDQYNKGLYVESTVNDMLRPAYYLTQGTKAQMKMPGSYKKGGATSSKVQQPVVTSTAAHMETIAGTFRALTFIIMSCLGPQICLSGAGNSMGSMYDRMRFLINWERIVGIDIRECDSSHIVVFIAAMQRFTEQLMPAVDKSRIAEIYAHIALVMTEWFTRARDGSVKATVNGQLASGLAWTFFWNCMWSITNIVITLMDEVGSDFHLVEPTLCLMAAGDDGWFTWHGNVQIPKSLMVSEFTNFIGVGLKLEYAVGAVEVCHYTWTANGYFVDAMRLLGKVVSRLYKGVDIIDQIKEYQTAVFVSIKMFLNSEYRAISVDALSRTHAQSKESVSLAIDLLHRFCNTPAPKLAKVLQDVTMRRATH